MGERLKWSAKNRAEKNWPIYVFTGKKGRVQFNGDVAKALQSVHEWADENFEGPYTTYLQNSDWMALIGIREERDAVRLMLWFDQSVVSITRLAKQRRNANGR